jgi:hypothetical protein
MAFGENEEKCQRTQIQYFIYNNIWFQQRQVASYASAASKPSLISTLNSDPFACLAWNSNFSLCLGNKWVHLSPDVDWPAWNVASWGGKQPVLTKCSLQISHLKSTEPREVCQRVPTIRHNKVPQSTEESFATASDTAQIPIRITMATCVQTNYISSINIRLQTSKLFF